jgi:hypothetical protein
MDRDPLIVPPTWNKTQYHKELQAVWRRAAQRLAEAENIFVIGYSLPPTDEFFRYLYALGTTGQVWLKRFWVFDPDQSGSVERRFRRLLGPMAKSKFKVHKEVFSHAIEQLTSELAQEGVIESVDSA